MYCSRAYTPRMPANGIVEPKEWLSRTARTLSSRSGTLVQVDGAYRAYYDMRSPQNAEKLYFLLEKYRREKGGVWARVTRNADSGGLMKAVYEISREQAHPGLGRAQFTESELEAIQFWKAQRALVAERFFGSCQLEVKATLSSLKLPKIGEVGISKAQAVGAVRQVYQAGEAVDVVRKLIGHIAQKTVDPVVVTEVVNFLISSGIIPEIAAQTATSLIPFKGVITSGGVAINSAIRAAYEVYEEYDAREHQVVLDTGTPQTAFRSLLLVIDRSKSMHLRKAAQSTLQAAASAVSQVLDPTHLSQVAISGAAAIASLTHLIFLVGRDFKERYYANKIMRDPSKIDAKLCEVHPILGCYLLVGAEKSTLMAFFGNFGDHGWMDEIEAAITQHLTPLQERAGDYIDNSRFILKRDGKAVYPIAGSWQKFKRWKNGQWDITPTIAVKGAGPSSAA